MAGARRPSGAEEGEAACRGRRGGGPSDPRLHPPEPRYRCHPQVGSQGMDGQGRGARRRSGAEEGEAAPCAAGVGEVFLPHHQKAFLSTASRMSAMALSRPSGAVPPAWTISGRPPPRAPTFSAPARKISRASQPSFTSEAETATSIWILPPSSEDRTATSSPASVFTLS